MKTRIILLLILLAIVALVVINLLPEGSSAGKLSEPEKENYRTLLLDEVELTGEQIIEGKLVPTVTRKIRFEVGGVLEKGDVPFKAGQEFRFNQLLLKVNMKEIFGPISELKTLMEQTLNDMMPEMNNRFPAEVVKWKNFLAELDPSTRLPAFPILNSKEEGDLLRSSGFLKAYVKAAELEEEVEKYFFLTPFEGTVLSVSKRPGSKIKAGETIGVIAKKGASVVQIERALVAQLKETDRIELLDRDGKVIGKGDFLRIQGANALFSFSPVGEQPKDAKVYMKIRNGVNCFRIPVSSVSGNKVSILNGETVSEREITVLKDAGDSLYVSGLKKGEILILR